jgi:hypothetical protein
VQPDTEKMMIIKELEREVKDLKRFESDALRVQDKTIATRLDRSGAINDVATIPPKKWNFHPTKK